MTKEKCGWCNGTGVCDYTTDQGPHSRVYSDDCNECDGTGEIVKPKFLDDEDDDI